MSARESARDASHNGARSQRASEPTIITPTRARPAGRRLHCDEEQCGIFGTHLRNPSNARLLGGPPSSGRPTNLRFRTGAIWPGSCLEVNEGSVFRATVLSIVLTLTAGPNVAVLCQAWCDPAQAATAGCHHEHGNPSAILTSTDACGNAVFRTAVLVKEDARGGLSSQAMRHPVVDRSPASASGTHPGDEPGCAWPLARRPLVTALRT